MRLLKANSKKPKNRKSTFSDESVDTFTYFQIWLHSKELPLTDISGEELDDAEFVDQYIFGEARDIPDFQNAVMDALITKDATSTAVSTGAIRRIYEHISKTSPLRKLFLDFVLHYLKNSVSEQDCYDRAFGLKPDINTLRGTFSSGNPDANQSCKERSQVIPMRAVEHIPTEAFGFLPQSVIRIASLLRRSTPPRD